MLEKRSRSTLISFTAATTNTYMSCNAFSAATIRSKSSSIDSITS
uniref:Uncharacterized protein n=1 Tax=Rhizophora mucronata TaxID=61149 RepID=A0A2P2J9X4_RHIMU